MTVETARHLTFSSRMIPAHGRSRAQQWSKPIYAPDPMPPALGAWPGITNVTGITGISNRPWRRMRQISNKGMGNYFAVRPEQWAGIEVLTPHRTYSPLLAPTPLGCMSCSSLGTEGGGGFAAILPALIGGAAVGFLGLYLLAAVRSAPRAR